MTESIWLALIPVFGTVLVNLISILPNLKKSNAETQKKFEEINAEMASIKQEFSNYKASDDDRYAQTVRVRILGFDDNLCDDGRRWPSDGSFRQALQDCDTYEQYIKSHPNFVNGIGEDAIDSIRAKYRTVKDNRLFGELK